MKLSNIYPFIFICIIIGGCQNNKRAKLGDADSSIFKDTTPVPDKDPRPTDETYFLNKIKAESDYEVTSDAIKKDAHISAFNKYMLDTLKKISNWEMIVTEINDNPVCANSFISTLGGDEPVYNLILTAEIKIDKTVDSVAINNRVDFTYTIPKSPKGEELKKQLEIIKTLSKGDAVIVSGSLTHLDASGKVNFASFYNSFDIWNIDLLLTDISKSKVNNYKYLNKY